MDRWFQEEKVMNKQVTTKLMREGEYAAEVELIDSDVGWAPYLSMEDLKIWTRCEWPYATKTFKNQENLSVSINSHR